ncbi:glycosyltransferase family 2 protein [Weissella confusa]|uniref:glycosyltransferase family 2 protein n=1 Tax=Weissella confusa TaxID=1583 RepID=UPI0018F26315|nr:glycosyltransferase family 2 protein [Weissella confusa]MBJ7670818.1 glycosyltransferase family 2 protein [Weissella confusa]
MNQIGAVVVTYNPDILAIDMLIHKIETQFSKILIVDNGSNNVSEIVRLTDKNIELIDLKENRGIATALNVGISAFSERKFEWVATFDQDSLPSEDFVEHFNSTNKENAGVIGSYYIDRNWSDEMAKTMMSRFKEYDDTTFVITSGAFVNVAVWTQINGFDDGLFIDWVDWDFNERVTMAGYKVFRTNQLILTHQVGEEFQPNAVLKILLGLKHRAVRDHSASRQYYIFRNRVIFYNRYRNSSKLAMLIKSVIAMRELLLLPASAHKILAAVQGTAAGFNSLKKTDAFFEKYKEKIYRELN